VKGIQVCSNIGPGPLQRGDNHKNVKMGWCHLKIFSRTTWPISTKLGTNHPWWKGIQVCSNERYFLSPRGDSKRVMFKENLLQNKPAKINQSCTKAMWPIGLLLLKKQLSMMPKILVFNSCGMIV
jgi:hypothetical protein